ncbi:MAG: Ldh family oxidoreductase [Pseudomonadota bacterium]
MTIKMTLDQAHDLAVRALQSCSCDEENAHAVADTMIAAERDICKSHGLFRLPGYLASLKSGKVNGSARPTIERIAPAVVRADGHNGFAPLTLEQARGPLTECARDNGIAALSIVRSHHFAALWIEVCALAEMGLCAFAFTAYKPSMAPAGGNKPFFGTNPMAFAWPRKDKPPMAFDQAASATARGDIMIAAREGREVEPGFGIDADGNPTTDPNEILKGAQLPFGGYKGSAIALMIELLIGPLIGERTSPESGRLDVEDGGPPQGGELMLAIDPTRFGNADGWEAQTEALFGELLEQEGVRLPADRRYQNREITARDGIEIVDSLYEKILKDTGLPREFGN